MSQRFTRGVGSRVFTIGVVAALLASTLTTAAGAQDSERAAQPSIPTQALERTGPGGETIMLLGSPYLTGRSDAAPGRIALDYVKKHRKRFDLTGAQYRQLVVRDVTPAAQSGASFVTLGQEIGDRRVANSGLTAVINANGRIASIGGTLARATARGGRGLTANEAVSSAGTTVGLDIGDLPRKKSKGQQKRFENTFATTRSPNPVTAELVWLPSPDGRRLTLVWETDFEVDGDTWLQSHVDARTGEVLEQANRYHHVGPEGTVFTGQHPDDSGPRAVTPFSGVDGTWVTDRVTSGNNVNAYRDLNDDNAVGYRPQTPANGDADYQHFNYPWTDAWRTNADGSNASLNADLDAAVTQLFYYTNVMHDWSKGFGFDEASRNFQIDNFGNGGMDSDPVLAEAQDGWNFGCLAQDMMTPIRCRNNANFGTPPDGTSPRMQMFMWSPPGRPYREGSMDGDVIAHEYGHGISTRLVGGGNTLGYGLHLVHASLGEGWSDVVSFLKWGDAVVGEYDTGNASTGIRSVAYDTSPLTYSDYNPNAGSGHPNGEVWATMIYDVREALGLAATTQLVFDGMKGTPGQPTFLDARDAIIAADTAAMGANFCLLWQIFADNGLGTGATFSKPSTSAPADNFDIPAACEVSADADGPYMTPEGTSVTLDGTGSTPSTDPSGGALTYEWDLDNDGQFDDAVGPTPTFTNVGDNGVFPVSLRVTNDVGTTDEDSTTVTVTNVDPTVTLDPVAGGPETTTVTLTGVVTDPGWLDTFTVTVDWDDGNGPQPLVGGVLENNPPDATLTFSKDFDYGDNGSYTIKVCATDDDGGSDCAQRVTQISNVDPTVDIDEDWYIAHAGDPLNVSGTTTDPGSDDLWALWFWGDGAVSSEINRVNPPTPDPPKSPSVQPRDVVWNAVHVYGEACLYNLALLVIDDDAGLDIDEAVVLITGNTDRLRGSGWWMNQYRNKPPNNFTTARLLCYLEIVKFLSDVFDEERAPLASRSDAVDILNVKQNQGSAEELFDEHLLAAWLNLANGAFDLDTPVDTDGDTVDDSTFWATISAAESVRLDPTATQAELLAQKDILERIVTG